MINMEGWAENRQLHRSENLAFLTFRGLIPATENWFAGVAPTCRKIERKQ